MSSTRKRKPNLYHASPGRRAVYRWEDFKDEWFRDKNGTLMYSQVPNFPLVLFMVSGVFAIVSYQGFWHTLAEIIAVVSILLWSWLEIRSGATRVRRLMGKLALAATIIVLILYLLP